MTKLESLKALKTKLESLKAEGKTNIAYLNYCDPEGKHCVIGYLLRIGGVTAEQLEAIDSGLTAYQYYGFKNILSDVINGQVSKEEDYVMSTIQKLGFEEKDFNRLNTLQKDNDHSKGSINYLLKEIDEWIFEIETK